MAKQFKRKYSEDLIYIPKSEIEQEKPLTFTFKSLSNLEIAKSEGNLRKFGDTASTDVHTAFQNIEKQLAKVKDTITKATSGAEKDFNLLSKEVNGVFDELGNIIKVSEELKNKIKSYTDAEKQAVKEVSEERKKALATLKRIEKDKEKANLDRIKAIELAEKEKLKQEEDYYNNIYQFEKEKEQFLEKQRKQELARDKEAILERAKIRKQSQQEFEKTNIAQRLKEQEKLNQKTIEGIETQASLRDKTFQEEISQILERGKQADVLSKQELKEQKAKIENQHNLNKANIESTQILKNKNAILSGEMTQAQLKLAISKKQLEYDVSSGLITKNSLEYRTRANALVKQELALKAQLNNQNQKESDYNSVMSIHSAKRAIGYTALFTAIATVTGAVSAMTSNFLEADLQTRTLGAVLDVPIEKAKHLSKNIRELGEEYGGTLKNIEDVALALGRAGIATRDIIPATEIVLRMARLTGDTFEQSASAIISFQQVFGDTHSIEQLGDKLAYIANVSRLSTQDIGTFSNYALASAQAVGLTADAVGGLASAFSNAGVNASTIGTQIRTFSGLLTESTNDAKQFFEGIGLSQEYFASRLQMGGEESNKAILELVDVLASLDSMDFNNLTGNMDKLTANVLNLMRNNKDNIQEFVIDLSNNVEGQLDNVDIILDSYKVTFESWWNNFLNFTQESISSLEETISERSLLEAIGKVRVSLDLLNNKPDNNANKLLIAEKERELDKLVSIKEVKEKNIKLTEIESKLAVAGQKDILPLMKEHTKIKLDIAKQTEKFTNKSISLSKEEAQAKEAQITEYINSLEAQKEAFERNSTEWKTLTNLIKDYRKELSKVSELQISVLTPKGLDLNTLASNIKNALRTDKKSSDLSYNLFYSEAQKQIEKNNKSINTYFDTSFKGREKEKKQIKEILASEDGLNKFRAFVTKKVQESNEAKAKLTDKNIKLTKEEKANLNEIINTNNNISKTLDEIESRYQKNAKIENTVKEVVKAKVKILDDEAKKVKEINDSKFNQKIIKAEAEGVKAGKKRSEILANEITLMKEKDTSTLKGIELEKWKEEILKKQTAYEKAIQSEKIKTKKESSRTKSIYAEINAEKDLQLIIQQTAQFKNKVSKEEARLADAKLSKLFIEKNIEKAIANGKKSDVSKLSRDLAKAELEIEKAKEAITVRDLDYNQRRLELLSKIENGKKGLTSAELKILDIEEKRKKLEELKASGTLTKQEIKEKELELLNLEYEKQSSLLEVEKERITLMTEEGQRALDNQLASLTNMQNIMSAMGSSDNAFVTNLVNLSNVMTDTQTTRINNDKELINLNDKYAKDFQEFAGNKEKLAELEVKAQEDYNNLINKSQTDQVVGYANIAGAVSSMFEQGSKEAEAFKLIQVGLATYEGITAILSQGKGDPYTAIPRMVAMAGMVAGLLSQMGATISAFSGGTKVSQDAFSAMKENTGTGSVLGDAEAQSESIVNSMGILEDFAKPQFDTLSEMNKYLASIDAKMGGIAGLIYQNAGFAIGEGFTASSKLNLQTSDIPVVGDIVTLFDDILSGLTGGLLDGITGGVLDKVLGGLFGKTSRSLTDAGIYFGEQLLISAIEEIEGSAYQTITTTKKSLFKKSSSTASYFQDLDAETERQFSLVLDNLYNTVLLAGDALNTSVSDIEKGLSDFVVNIGKISLKDKTGEEVQEQLSAVFGEIGDNIAETAFPLMTGFQQIGEGILETLVRVSTGMTEATYFVDRLGNSFNVIDYTAIENMQGDVGFEALSQSLIEFEESLHLTNNGVIDIIENLSGSAEDLYDVYVALDVARDYMKFFGNNVEGLTSTTLYGAGGISELNEAIETYFEEFFTDQEQLIFNTQQMNNSFAELGLVMPKSIEEFKSLVEGIDLTTEAGQDLYGRVLLLAEGFSDLADESGNVLNSLQLQLADMTSSLTADITEMLGVLKTNVEKVQTTIDKLLSSDTENTLASSLIQYNKALAEYQMTGSQESLDAILTYAQEASTLGGNNVRIADELEGIKAGLTEEDKILQVELAGLQGESILNLSDLKVNGIEASLSVGDTDAEVFNKLAEGYGWNLSSYVVKALSSKYDWSSNLTSDVIATLNSEYNWDTASADSLKEFLIAKYDWSSNLTSDIISSLNSEYNWNTASADSLKEFLIAKYDWSSNLTSDVIASLNSEYNWNTASADSLKEFLTAKYDWTPSDNDVEALLSSYNWTGIGYEKALTMLDANYSWAIQELTKGVGSVSMVTDSNGNKVLAFDWNNDSNIDATAIIGEDGILSDIRTGVYDSDTNTTLSTLNELTSAIKKYNEFQTELLTKESEGLTSKTFSYGDYIGTQEQADIARLAGTSYDNVSGTITALQNLDVSSDITSDVRNLLLDENGYVQSTTYANISPFLEYLSPNIQATVNKTTRLGELQQKYDEAKAIYEEEALEKDNAFNTWRTWFNSVLHYTHSNYGEIEEDITRGRPFTHYGSFNYWGSQEPWISWSPLGQEYLSQFNEAYTAYKEMNTLQGQLARVQGYAQGGYTGDLPINAIAGVTHGQEYVVNARTTRDLGLNNSAGVFKEMLFLMKEAKDEASETKEELVAIKQENQDMKKLLIRLTADNSNMLNIERAVYADSL